MLYFRRSYLSSIVVAVFFATACGGESSTGPAGLGGAVIHVMGQATFSDGSPYPGAMVRLYAVECDFSAGGVCTFPALGSDVTDSQGRYDIVGLRTACQGRIHHVEVTPLTINGTPYLMPGTEIANCSSSVQVFDFVALSSPPPTS